MPYRVSLESGVDEAIEEVDCEDWAAVHAALDKWHSQVHFSGRYIMVSAFEKRFKPWSKPPGETEQASLIARWLVHIRRSEPFTAATNDRVTIALAALN